MKPQATATPTTARRTRHLLNSVFTPPTSRQVPGLLIATDAVSPEEERHLLQQVDDSPVGWTHRRTRLTKNYGPYYLYSERDTPDGRFRVTDGVIHHTDLPPFLYDTLLPIVRKALPLLQGFEPNQVHVALYRHDDDGRIRMHNDNKMGTLGPYIVGVCLLSDTVMTFVRPRDNRKRIVRLPRRCVYVMTGESHFEWRHGILSGDTPHHRVSFTLRDVRALAVEEGVKVSKSSHKPSAHSIEQQRIRDERRRVERTSDCVVMSPSPETSATNPSLVALL